MGVSMIQNFDAADASLTWPQVESNDCLAGRVPEFADNLRLLARLGLVFELHANPHQLVDAAALLRSLTEVNPFAAELASEPLEATLGSWSARLADAPTAGGTSPQAK